MFTQCPDCKTIFSVSQEQLRIARGTVRCGLCQGLFQADENIVQQKVKTRKRVARDSRANNDVEIEQKQHEDQQQAIATLFLQEETPVRNRRAMITFTLLSSLAAFLLVIQSGLLISHNWVPAQLQIGLCSVFHCINEPARRDVRSIEVVTRGVYSHPSQHGALMVTATIINHAAFAQPYPDIGLVLLDVHGEPVAGRQFNPAEYVVDTYNPNDFMEKDQLVAINLEISDPGTQVIGYEFSFY